MGMYDKLNQVLDDFGITLFYADEVSDRLRRGTGWVWISDVGSSRSESAIAIPRRKRSAYQVAEALHEIAHLQRWRWLNKSPAKDKDSSVCQLALDICHQYGFGEAVEEWLVRELTDAMKADHLLK